MELTFLGGAHEVGRSAVLFSGKKNVLLDYGVKLNEKKSRETEYPLKLKKHVDALIVSHAHLDHSSYSPMLYNHASVPCIATYPTQALMQMLITDFLKIAGRKAPFPRSAFKRMVRDFFPAVYNREYDITHGGVKFKLHDAGHIPGSAMVELNSEGKKIVYTGDFNMRDTMLQKGAEPLEDVDVLIIESTYGDREHTDRKEVVRKMKEDVMRTVEDGGNVLMPCFAVGRSQEVVMLLREFDREMPIYLDGMAKGASEIMLNYPKYVRDPHALSEALGSIGWLERASERRLALDEPGVIVSTAGMLTGGPAPKYMLRMNGNPKAKVIMTGFCVENTNGWHLKRNHRIKVDNEWVDIHLPVKDYDLSAHVGKSDLMKFIDAASPEKVLCMHGDAEVCDGFAEELRGKGYDAHAPNGGETVKL